MIEKALIKIRKIVEYAILSMIVIMTVIIGYQVFSRFVLNFTPPWIQPLSLLLMVWIGFIGIAIGIQDNTHIKINLFVSMMPDKVQKVLIYMQRVLAILFGFFMLVQGLIFSYDMKDSTMSGLSMPSAVLYASIPISGLLVVLYLLFEFSGKWKGPNHENEEVE